MELENPKDFPIVMIKWLDSIAPRAGGWYDVDLTSLKKEPLEVVSAGFILRWTDEVMIICSAYHCDNDNDNKVISTIGCHSIPLMSVIEMEWLYKPENWEHECSQEIEGED